MCVSYFSFLFKLYLLIFGLLSVNIMNGTTFAVNAKQHSRISLSFFQFEVVTSSSRQSVTYLKNFVGGSSLVKRITLWKCSSNKNNKPAWPILSYNPHLSILFIWLTSPYLWPIWKDTDTVNQHEQYLNITSRVPKAAVCRFHLYGRYPANRPK